MFRVTSLSLVALSVTIVTCSTPFAAADDPPDSAGSSILVISDCRVQFVRRRQLASDRSGILSEVTAEGRSVDEDQVVAILQDLVPRSTLAVAEARAGSDVDVRLAEKEHARALAEYEGAQAANEEAAGNRPAYPEIEITRRRLAAESAALQIEQAQRDLEVLRKSRDEADAELQSYSVRSPISGTVVRVLKDVGEGVQLAEPILEVVNSETARVEGFVPLDQLALVEVGMPVQVFIDLSGPGESPAAIPVPPAHRPKEAGPYEGRIGFIDLALQPVARSVRVWADVENTDGQLRDGMTARMEIEPESTVPEQP